MAAAHSGFSFGSRLPGADNARCMAMLAVFTVHAISVLFNGRPGWLLEVCRSGTDVFMVLTGCLIHRSVLSHQHGYGSFLARRSMRIFPVFLAVLALYVFVLYPLLPSHSKLPPDFGVAGSIVLANVVLVPLVFGATPIITVSWTLGYIFTFYVVAFPAIKWTAGFARPIRLLIWGGVTVGVWLILGRAALIPSGVLLSELLASATPPAWTCCLFLAAGSRIALSGNLRIIGAGVAAFVFCWWILPRPSHATARQLSCISYSFYLTHGLTILTASHIPAPPAVTVLVSFVLAIAASVACYTLIEKPWSPLTPRPQSMVRNAVEVGSRRVHTASHVVVRLDTRIQGGLRLGTARHVQD